LIDLSSVKVCESRDLRNTEDYGLVSLSRSKSQYLEKKELRVKEEDRYAMSQQDETEKEMTPILNNQHRRAEYAMHRHNTAE